jgi:hypothetical protein
MFRSRGRIIIKGGLTVAREYMNFERFEEARNHIEDQLRDMPTMADIHRFFDSGGRDAIAAWDGMLREKARACFFLGDRSGMLEAARQRREVFENRLAWDKGRSDFTVKQERTKFVTDYWFCLNGWVLLNGDPEEARKLFAEWLDLCKAHGNGRVLSPTGTSSLYNFGPIMGDSHEIR